MKKNLNNILLLLVFILLIPLISQRNFLLTEEIFFNISMWDTVNVYDWANSFYKNNLKPISDFWYPYLFQIYFYPYSFPGNILLYLKSFLTLVFSFFIWVNFLKKDYKNIFIFICLAIIFFYIFNLKYQDRYYLTVLLLISYYMLFNQYFNKYLGFIVTLFLTVFMILYELNLAIFALTFFILYLFIYSIISIRFKFFYPYKQLSIIATCLFLSVLLSYFILILYFENLDNFFNFYSSLSDIFQYASWKFKYYKIYKIYSPIGALLFMNIFLTIYLTLVICSEMKNIKDKHRDTNELIFLFILILLSCFFSLKSIMRDVSQSFLFLPFLIILLIIFDSTWYKKYKNKILFILIIILVVNFNIFKNKYDYFFSQTVKFYSDITPTSNDYKIKGFDKYDEIRSKLFHVLPDIKSENIYIASDDSYIYSMLGKKNKFFTNNFYNSAPFDIQSKIINQLNGISPKYVIINRENMSFYEVSHKIRVAKIFNYLSYHYVPFSKVDKFDILVKKDLDDLKIDGYWFNLLSDRIYLKKIPYYYESTESEQISFHIDDVKVIDKMYSYTLECKHHNVQILFDIQKGKIPKNNVFNIPKSAIWSIC